MTNPFKPRNPEKPEDLPKELPILPLRNSVPFPFVMIPLTVGIPRSVKLIEDALKGNSLIGMIASRDPSVEEPAPDQVYTVGTVGRILRVVRAQDGTMQVVVQGLERIRVANWLAPGPYMKARIEAAPEKEEPDLEQEGLVQGLRSIAQEVIDLSPTIPREAANFLNSVSDPRYLAYLVAGNAQLEPADAQKILEMDSVKEKLRAIIAHLAHQKEVLSLGQKIRTEAKEEMEKDQREYILRQQMKAIQKELGEMDENPSIVSEYTEKIEKSGTAGGGKEGSGARAEEALRACRPRPPSTP